MDREEIFNQVREEIGGSPLLGEPQPEQGDEVFNAPEEPEQNEETASPEPTPEQPPVADEGEFVYDDGEIRRTFNSELELKSFESGVKSNEIGRLRKEVEALKAAQGEKPEQPKQSREEYLSNLVEIAWPDTTAEQRQSPELQRIAEGMDRLLVAFRDQVMEPSLSRVSGDVEQMRHATAEERAMHQHGVTAEQVKAYIQKRPSLANLPVADQVAIAADALKGQKAEKAPDPLNAALKPDASGYVEPSARNPASDPSTALEASLKGKSGRELQQAFGKAFEESGIGADLTF